MRATIQNRTIGLDVMVSPVYISDWTTILLEVPAPVPKTKVCTLSLLIDVIPSTVFDDRREPAVVSECPLVPSIICWASIEMDMVGTRIVTDGS
jgi:hypothetical protein